MWYSVSVNKHFVVGLAGFAKPVPIQLSEIQQTINSPIEN